MTLIHNIDLGLMKLNLRFKGEVIFFNPDQGVSSRFDLKNEICSCLTLLTYSMELSTTREASR
jgi:hypothetical protein